MTLLENVLPTIGKDPSYDGLAKESDTSLILGNGPADLPVSSITDISFENSESDKISISFIPLAVREQHGVPGQHDEIRFRCRRGLERCYIIISPRGIKITSRVMAPCTNPKICHNEGEGTQKVAMPVSTLNPSITQKSVKMYQEMTRLQKSILRNDLRSPSKNISRVPFSFIQWDAVCGLVTIRKSYFESYLGIEVITGTVVKVIVSTKLLDTVSNTIKAFYCSACSGLVKHAHHEKASAPPTSITMRTPRWDARLSPRSGSSRKHMHDMFSLCMKRSSIHRLESSKSLDVVGGLSGLDSVDLPDEPSTSQNLCPHCRLRRGGSVDARNHPKTSNPKFSPERWHTENYKEVGAKDKVSWLYEATADAVIMLPLDTVARMLVFNEALPSRKTEALTEPNKDIGGLTTFLYSDDNAEKVPWGTPSESYYHSNPFPEALWHLTGALPPLEPTRDNWNPMVAQPIKMTSKHPIPDNFIINRILALLPAIPFESDGLEIMKLIHCSPEGFELEWSEYIVTHRDKEGGDANSGLPGVTRYGGLIPTVRMIFRHHPGIGGTSSCQCATAIYSSLGFRYNDGPLYLSDTQSAAPPPSTFQYSDTVSSGPMRIITSFVGKQEGTSAMRRLVQLLTDQCEYLACAPVRDREEFLRPLAAHAAEGDFKESPTPLSSAAFDSDLDSRGGVVVNSADNDSESPKVSHNLTQESSVFHIGRGADQQQGKASHLKTSLSELVASSSDVSAERISCSSSGVRVTRDRRSVLPGRSRVTFKEASGEVSSAMKAKLVSTRVQTYSKLRIMILLVVSCIGTFAMGMGISAFR